jgi:hypothetical protein
MSMLTADSTITPAPVYEPPTLTVLGSVEAITLSSTQGSYCDGHSRSNKKSALC